MRRASLIVFFVGLAACAAALAARISAFNGTVVSHPRWLLARGLNGGAVLLFVASVVLAIAAPSDRQRRTRMWWVVPATVLAIVLTCFEAIIGG
jgi:uncharacterized membrane-anchored protein